MFNSFGNILRLTSFGESHGKGVGVVIDGFPAGIVIDRDFVQAELDRRRPGQSRITTEMCIRDSHHHDANNMQDCQVNRCM